MSSEMSRPYHAMIPTFRISNDFISYLLGDHSRDTYSSSEGKIWACVKKYGGVVVRTNGAVFPTDAFFGRNGLRRFVDDLERSNVPLSVSPRSRNISESTRPGYFHNDYTIHSYQPDFVCIRCIDVDPRHPFYGRNQIALVNHVAKKLSMIAPEALKSLMEVEFPCKIIDHCFSVVPMLIDGDGNYSSRIHLGYVDIDRLEGSHRVNGINTHELMDLVAAEVCSDFALNRNDTLIASNKYALHRRGECSIKFSKSLDGWRSRKIDTTRYIY